MSSDIAARFGANVARCRKRAGISQEQLSVRASLHRTEVSQIERGMRLCRIDTLLKLTGSLGVTPDELLAGMDWMPGAMTYGRFRSAEEAELR